MDPCPIYEVRIRGDGSVTYNGPVLGSGGRSAQRQVSVAAARSLIEKYRSVGFWRMCDRRYGDDGPEVVTTVRIGGSEKSIKGTPDWDIYRSVGELAGTYYWLRGDPANEVLVNSICRDDVFAPKPGFTRLMSLASIGNLSGTQQQLASDSQVDAQDASGFTALMCAARRGHRDIMQALISAGADPNIRSNTGQTAFMAASISGNVSEEMLGALVRPGADVNAQDRDGQSALMLAAPQAEPAIITFMLKSGAYPDTRDARGLSASSRIVEALSLLEKEAEDLKTLDGSKKEQRLAGFTAARNRLQKVQSILIEK